MSAISGTNTAQFSFFVSATPSGPAITAVQAGVMYYLTVTALDSGGVQVTNYNRLVSFTPGDQNQANILSVPSDYQSGPNNPWGWFDFTGWGGQHVFGVQFYSDGSTGPTTTTIQANELDVNWPHHPDGGNERSEGAGVARRSASRRRRFKWATLAGPIRS